jgi:hypothetical protein
MTTRKCTNWIKSFVEYASIGEAPLSMYFWVGVSTVAGALRRRVWYDQEIFKWYPSFYIVLVAPPGIVSKSTTASIGMKLLRDVPGVKFGPNIVTWQALATAFTNSLEMVEMPDGTFYPMSAMTIESSEFGNLLDPSNREMVDLLVSLWDCNDAPLEKMTKTQGNDLIENPFLNIIACTTPAWIAGYVPDYVIGGGFTSRCIFVYADKKRQYKAYLDEELTPKERQARTELKQALIHDLEFIGQLRGAFHLTPEARAWGKEWYQQVHEVVPAHLRDERFGGYISRKQTHLHKIAMVLSAARRDDLIIDLAILQEANTVLSTIEPNMNKVFDKIGQTDDTRKSSSLVTTLNAAGGTLESGELYKMLFRTMSYDDFTMALKSAIMAGHVVQKNEAGKLLIRSLRSA